MRIAAYCRVSTEKDEQLDSLENQKTFFADYAAKNNCVLQRLYADEGVSGKQMKNRAQFLQMLRDAERGLFDMVVVKDISRFARNTVDFLVAVRKLKSLGIETQFLSNNQTVLGSSEFVLTVFSALAQEESASLSKRVKFGKKVNAKKGRVPPEIFGYNRIDNFTLEINPLEADTVRKIFDMYVNRGLGCHRIALSLHESGIKTKRGREWTGQYVRRVLKNSIYCGLYVNNKGEVTDYLEGTRGKISPDRHFHHERPAWAIIGRDLYEAASVLLQKNRERYKNAYTHTQGRSSTRHILSTLIKCAHCGRSYSRRQYTYRRTSTYWVCSRHNKSSAYCDNARSVSEEALLGRIKGYLRGMLPDEDAFAESLLKQPADRHGGADDAQRRKSALAALAEKYKSMYTSGIITLEELKLKIAPVQSELQKANAPPQAQAHASADMAREARRLLTLDSLTNVDLKQLIDKITVSRDGEIMVYIRDFAKACDPAAPC